MSFMSAGGVAAAAASVVLAAALAACRSSPPPTSSDACGPHPFEHVYHPQRLKVLDGCRTVTGVIANVKREPDGDLHIRLTVDDVSLLNDKNRSDQHGDLVLEPVCEGPVTQEDAKDACRDYTSDVQVPPVGTRIAVTGPWVLDKEHGWNEIHPAMRIEVAMEFQVMP